MIVKVKIAPLEYWCERALRHAEEDPLLKEWVGQEVEILTETMHVQDGERYWHYAKAPNPLYNGYRTCEHVLEMD